MAEKTLQDIFGMNAIQDIDSVTIYKSDLEGLTATEENLGDPIAVAILKLLVSAYTPTVRAADKDVSLVVLPQPPQVVTENALVNNVNVQTSYLNKPLVVNIYNLFNTTGLTPDDYA